MGVLQFSSVHRKEISDVSSLPWTWENRRHAQIHTLCTAPCTVKCTLALSYRACVVIANLIFIVGRCKSRSMKGHFFITHSDHIMSAVPHSSLYGIRVTLRTGERLSATVERRQYENACASQRWWRPLKWRGVDLYALRSTLLIVRDYSRQ